MKNITSKKIKNWGIATGLLVLLLGISIGVAADGPSLSPFWGHQTETKNGTLVLTGNPNQFGVPNITSAPAWVSSGDRLATDKGSLFSDLTISGITNIIPSPNDVNYVRAGSYLPSSVSGGISYPLSVAGNILLTNFTDVGNTTPRPVCANENGTLVSCPEQDHTYVWQIGNWSQCPLQLQAFCQDLGPEQKIDWNGDPLNWRPGYVYNSNRQVVAYCQESDIRNNIFSWSGTQGTGAATACAIVQDQYLSSGTYYSVGADSNYENNSDIDEYWSVFTVNNPNPYGSTYNNQPITINFVNDNAYPDMGSVGNCSQYSTSSTCNAQAPNCGWSDGGDPATQTRDVICVDESTTPPTPVAGSYCTQPSPIGERMCPSGDSSGVDANGPIGSCQTGCSTDSDCGSGLACYGNSPFPSANYCESPICGEAGGPPCC